MKKELSVIEIQTLISNNVAQWLLISFRTMSFSQARIIVCILIFIICWCLFTLVDWLFKHAKNIPFYKIGPSITMGFQKCSLFLSYTMIESSRHLFTYYSTYLAVPLQFPQEQQVLCFSNWHFLVSPLFHSSSLSTNGQL